MTNVESFAAIKSEIGNNVANVPAEISLTNMDTFEDYTLNTETAKIELIAALEKIDAYTPAFAPVDNVRHGLMAMSADAKTVLEYAIATTTT